MLTIGPMCLPCLHSPDTKCVTSNDLTRPHTPTNFLQTLQAAAWQWTPGQWPQRWVRAVAVLGLTTGSCAQSELTSYSM